MISQRAFDMMTDFAFTAKNRAEAHEITIEMLRRELGNATPERDMLVGQLERATRIIRDVETRILDDRFSSWDIIYKDIRNLWEFVKPPTPDPAQ